MFRSCHKSCLRSRQSFIIDQSLESKPHLPAPKVRPDCTVLQAASSRHFSWRDSVKFDFGTVVTNTARFIEDRPPGLVVIAFIAILGTRTIKTSHRTHQLRTVGNQAAAWRAKRPPLVANSIPPEQLTDYLPYAIPLAVQECSSITLPKGADSAQLVKWHSIRMVDN